MLARFSEKYYQLQINTEGVLCRQYNKSCSIKIDREYIETKIRNDSDSDTKKTVYFLTLIDIINIINREQQRCYYCKMLLTD